MTFDPDTSGPSPADAARALLERAAREPLAWAPAPRRHAPGDVLDLPATGVCPARSGRVTLRVERAVGGGFAGQVYRVELLAAQGLEGLAPGGRYALKLLRPPTAGREAFRDLLFRAAFQAPFAPAWHGGAARVGVLWQALLRRAAALTWGSERHVVAAHASVVDPALGCHGDLNEWVEGRPWRLEPDPRLFSRRARLRGDAPDTELVEKRRFMARLVALLHDMGAVELARQYEWGSWKSQPNVLRRLDGAGELTAIDLRAGLSLLAWLPMSPVDVRLTLRGLARGRLAQFDRADLDRLDAYVAARRDDFADLLPAVDELRAADAAYRGALPDLLNHPLRAVTRVTLPAAHTGGTAAMWRARGLVDAPTADRLAAGGLRFRVALWAWCVPLLGPLLVRLVGHGAFRAHLARLLGSPRYALAALRASRLRALAAWVADGRAAPARALALADRPLRFAVERVAMGPLPAAWHRHLIEPRLLWARLREAVAFPVRLYRHPDLRRRWLLDTVEAARADGSLSDDDAVRATTEAGDPRLDGDLHLLAVSACAVVVSRALSVLLPLALGVGFVVAGRGWAEGAAVALGALAAFHVLPLSPGSLFRGAYVTWFMLRARDPRGYGLAAALSWWHYVGHLGVPLQMAARAPVLARVLVTRWSTALARRVPVWGERGALLEHAVFDVCHNLPLSLAAARRAAAEGAASMTPPPLPTLIREALGRLEWRALALPFVAWLAFALLAMAGLAPEKDPLEALAVIGLGVAALVGLGCWAVDRHPYFAWSTALITVLLCREIHFAGTGKGVYVGLALLLIIAWRRYPALADYLGTRAATTVFTLGMTSYALSQTIDQRWWRRILPGERVWHVPAEESLELLGHALVAGLLLVTPLAGSPAAARPHPLRRALAALRGVRPRTVGAALAALLILAIGLELGLRAVGAGRVEALLRGRDVAAAPPAAPVALAALDGADGKRILLLGDLASLGPGAATQVADALSTSLGPDVDVLSAGPPASDVDALAAWLEEEAPRADAVVVEVPVRQAATTVAHLSQAPRRQHTHGGWLREVRNQSQLYRCLKRLPSALFMAAQGRSRAWAHEVRRAGARLPAYRCAPDGPDGSWAALEAALARLRAAAPEARLVLLLTPDQVQLDLELFRYALKQATASPDEVELLAPQEHLRRAAAALGLEVVDVLAAVSDEDSPPLPAPLPDEAQARLTSSLALALAASGQ
ncbi:MAG: hypothetical protein M9894_19245 [Planctomycetes bacterium]|nr:hypothetical protein [Planctomycetota bacterium]